MVTGGAGFIGSHMVYRLLKEGNKVTVVDKIAQDQATRLKSLRGNQNFSYLQMDLSKVKYVDLRGFETIIHFAALSDASLGYANPKLDLKNGIFATFTVLDSMRINGIKNVIFSSSSTVYGYPSKIPTSEDSGLLFPVSMYGASKLSSEALISAFCYLYGIRSWIFRFGNVIGGDSSKGVIYDLVKKLMKNSTELEVLGDGEQVKDYIHVDDLIDAILTVFSKTSEKINVFNVGSGILSVKEIVKIILEEMKLKNTVIKYTGGPAGWKGGGWPGDVKKVHYDISKINEVGWKPKILPQDAVRLTVRNMTENMPRNS